MRMSTLRSGRIPGLQNVVAGLVLIALAGLAYYLIQDLRVGVAMRMGPGYVPRLICIVLAVLGVGIAISGFVRAGAPIGVIPWRAVALVIGSIAVFGLLIDRIGLMAAGIFLLLMAGSAAPDFRWREGVVFAVLLAGAAVLVFPYALGVPMPVWPI
jgi:putative tricarboxylic transport membrane protein